MGRVLSWLRLLPGFRSAGHPVRKVIAGTLYGFVALTLLASLFGSPTTSTNNQKTTPSGEVAGTTSAPIPSDTSTPIPADLIQVVNVVDGDTVRLSDGKVVRLIGIDTPEIGNQSACFGQEASKKADELLQDQFVRLEKDVSETDRYNRLLRYVWKGDDLVNETLVAQGYARVSTYPPDVKYQDRFLAAEKAAREANLGLWSSCITPTTKPTTPKPTVKANPTSAPKPPTQPPAQGGAYTCNCSKTCPNMSCAEAQYQLNVCGCSARDADDDGTACDSQCQ